MIADPDAHERTGLPRPLAEDNNGTMRPVPWSQDNEARWGVLDTYRAGDLFDNSNCLVCGDDVETGWVIMTHSIVGVEIINQEHLNRQAVLDHGPLHDRCLKITRAHCITVRIKLISGEFFILAYEREGAKSLDNADDPR